MPPNHPPKRITRLTVLGLIAALVLAGCSGSKPHATYGRVYKSDDGRYYTRSYYNGHFWYWGYTDSCASCGSMPDGGAWGDPSTSISVEIKPTNQVVRVVEGKPGVKPEEEEEVEADKVVDETTTTPPDDTSSSSSDSADSGSSSSSDSGGSDSGGGDGGD